MTLTNEQLTEIEKRAERAHAELGDVCADGVVNRWRMSIPANPQRDSDLIISAGLDDVETLLTEVKRLRRERTRVLTELTNHRKIARSHVEERDRLRGEWDRAQAEADKAEAELADARGEIEGLVQTVAAADAGRDRLVIELAKRDADLNDAEQQRARIEEERHRLAEQVARARALHSPMGSNDHVCGTCPDHLGYPCPTRLALGGGEPTYPEPGSAIPDMPGYVVGKCTHRVAASEWRAGFRVCERCPYPDGDGSS